MFENLSERLSLSLKKISGKASLSESNIQETLREVRVALLEADVALPVVKDFIELVKQRAVGTEVSSSLNPGQQFLKIVQAELETVMGEKNETLNLKAQPPAVILMAGLQGAGKTTSVAKLSRYLSEREKKKVMVVSADVYRPAAIDQLKTLASGVGAEFFPSTIDQKPTQIVSDAIAAARTQFVDVLIVDTAGRLAIDEQMMDEIKQVHKVANPIETLFVIDAMIGQDSVNTAKAFNEALPLTGVILTKVDGDARGGAALSMRAITGKPIKFIGVSEKLDGLETFHPERAAGRILDMGDVVSLVERAQEQFDEEEAKKLHRKIKKNKFDFNDFRDQINQIKKMGGMKDIAGMIPGMKKAMQGNEVDENTFVPVLAMIDSMTPMERENPDIINMQRKKRIAGGSGNDLNEVNKLLKQFNQTKKMMKLMSNKQNMMNMMKQFKRMGGRMPM